MGEPKDNILIKYASWQIALALILASGDQREGKFKSGFWCSGPWSCTGEHDITKTVTQFSEKENYIAMKVDLCRWVDER